MTIDRLRRLLELTTLPPEGDDVDALLAAFTAMYEARRRVLEEATGPRDDSPEARALLAELAARDAAWASALAIALERVGAARQNASKLRSYTR